jgi:hypothetical protein
MQNAYNSAKYTAVYYPPGSYLNRGQNWTQSGAAAKGKTYSNIGWGGANIYSVNVTDPGGAAGSSKVGVQHTGYIDRIESDWPRPTQGLHRLRGPFTHRSRAD